jgi:mRNA interferase MazF
MTRGEIVVVATKGAYSGKPRPTLIVQADVFNDTHSSVTVCPITSDCIDAPLFRIPVASGPRTGLRNPSQVMVDKVLSVPRSAISQRVGRCDRDELARVAEALRLWLALE